MRVLASLGILLTFGCVDPEGEYEAFQRRIDDGFVEGDSGAGGTDGDGGDCTPTSRSGEYVLALSVSIAPTTPIVATVSLVGTDDPPAIEFETIQPVGSADRSSPVGSSFSSGPFDAVDGKVTAAVSGLEVAGDANPISGSDIAADVVLSFDLCAPQAILCGDVTGSVTAPLALDLAGSTFTMTPADEVDLGALTIDCAGNLADPL